ncbi:MAG: ATP-binding protein [Methanobrevibacter sp.]|nr:ATP-binding protein [Methanobrevibacter sp.]
MVRREIYMKKINSLIGHELIKVITGIRRSGKSYLLKLIIEELKSQGVNEKNIILINFDTPKYNHIENTRELDLLVGDMVKDIKGKIYLFFDEIQNIDEWEKSIAGYQVIYDCDIYITGSNSKMLSGELATHLTGRYIQIKVYPFSFNEFKEFKHERQSLKEIEGYEYPVNKKEPSREELFEEYLIYGGMPVVQSLDEEYKLEYLKDVYTSIITNDILNRYEIRDVNLLKRIIEFLIDNTGKETSLKNIVKYLQERNIKIAKKTIYNYVEYMEEACLILKAKKENLEGKEILKLNEKYYIADHGFSQAIVGKNKKNISRIIENIVFIELLRRGYDVSVGNIDGKEVDFVCKKFEKTIYIQVCYELKEEKTIKREFAPLLNIKDNYPKYIISMDTNDNSDKGIINLNLIDFLEDYSLI